MSYSIDQFWLQTFSGTNRQTQATPYAGWSYDLPRQAAYVQTGLNLRDDFCNLNAKVWLIGAPGAVGKTALAKEICAVTGATYLDLSTAATVAGNYVIGGLVYAGLFDAWKAGNAALVIDALDEARLRVTQSGFEAFLADVAKTAAMGKYPVVVFGRVGIIEEAWAILSELANVDAPIFDIELFDNFQAYQFVHARLRALSTETNSSQHLTYPDLQKALHTHESVYREVVEKIIDGLQRLSVNDGNRFVGYAPVLDAVAKVIASESNPARIGEEMQRVMEGKVLSSLSNEILRREQGKLINQLQATVSNLPAGLYGPDEQLERLGARIFNAPPPPIPVQLSPQQIGSYEAAVSNLLPQHPFLDGSGTSPSGAVFGAAIVAATLNGKRSDLSKAAEVYAGSSKHTPNPFLYDFYQEKTQVGDLIPTEHVGLIFDSVLARANPGESVRLSVEGDEDDPNLSVEIVVDRLPEPPLQIELSAPRSGVLRFGRKVAGVTIDAEDTDVELGSGDQLELVAPLYISARSLTLLANQISVRSEPNTNDTTVILESKEVHTEPGLSAPAVRAGTQLQVSWPDANSYPWTSYATPQDTEESPQTAAALRILRRLVMAFRSHSKGQLARFKDKIEHQRMLKGEIGKRLLAKLLKDQVIFLKAPMYLLDANMLGAKVGASYADVKLKAYKAETREYLQDVIEAQAKLRGD